jgi:hypothetical protein
MVHAAQVLADQRALRERRVAVRAAVVKGDHPPVARAEEHERLVEDPAREQLAADHLGGERGDLPAVA